MVVVELERADPGGVGLEAQDEDVAHQTHVLADVLGNSVGRTWDVRLFEGRPPSLKLAPAARALDSLLDFTHRIEIFVELALVARADRAAEIVGVGRAPRRARSGRPADLVPE